MSDTLQNSIPKQNLHEELRKSNLLKRDSLDSVHKQKENSNSKTNEAE